MLKYGKKPAVTDPRTLNFNAFVHAAALPAIPAQVSYQNALPAALGLMANDQFKDCTCAAAGHLIMCWTANRKDAAKIIPDDQIISAYAAASDFDPETGGQDDGADMLTVLKNWESSGIGGDQIDSFVAADFTRQEELQQAIYLFGGCIVGLNLPDAVPPDQAETWEVPDGEAPPNSLNAHAIPLVGYIGNQFTGISFGKLVNVSFDFITRYGDEAYAILSSQDWLTNGQNINGFDLAALQNDLQAIQTNSA